MATYQPDVQIFEALSIVNASVAFGNRSTLDLMSVANNAWGYTGASASRLTAIGESAVAGMAVRFDTLIGDLKKRGIL